MRFHFTWLEWPWSKKSTNNKYWRGCGEKGTLPPLCRWEYKLLQLLWRTGWRFHKKLNKTLESIKVLISQSCPILCSSINCRTTMRACLLRRFICVQLSATLWTVAHQAPLSMGFSSQEYWSGLPFPLPRNPSDPGVKPASHVSCFGRQVLYH